MLYIMSNWTKYVTKYYKEEKKKNGGYQFKDALRDAAKTYKKQGNVDEMKGSGKGKKSRTRKNRTRKQKK